MKYLVVVEESASGFSAYSPDVPGCIATGSSRSDVERRIAQAIAFHIEGLRTEGFSVPEPHSFSAYVDVPA
jgi:predicted RNase H-like HicB family nuclease